MQCSQCQVTAFRMMGDTPLCVDHWTQVARVMQEQNRQAMAEINYLEDHMSAMWGGIVPPRHYQIPQDIIHTGDTTVNNIKIDRSTVGVLNTGTVETLNSSVTTIQETNPELAEEVTKLVEAVSSDTNLEQEARKEVIEQVSYVLSQLSVPSEQRNASVLKSVFAAIGTTLSVSADVYALWTALHPALAAHFPI